MTNYCLGHLELYNLEGMASFTCSRLPTTTTTEEGAKNEGLSL